MSLVSSLHLSSLSIHAFIGLLISDLSMTSPWGSKRRGAIYALVFVSRICRHAPLQYMLTLHNSSHKYWYYFHFSSLSVFFSIKVMAEKGNISTRVGLFIHNCCCAVSKLYLLNERLQRDFHYGSCLLLLYGGIMVASNRFGVGFI